MKKIATKIIAKLRNETFYSLNSLNNAILNELNIFNSAPFQKRNGSRNSIFEFEEKRYLKPLPRVPYEVSTWYYSLKVMYNSHISFRNNFYSVPYKYINKNVDVKIYNSNLYVYYKKELIASHPLILSNEKNKYITNKGHLDKRKEFKKDTVDSLKKEALQIGIYTFKVVEKLFSEYKLEEQALNSVNNVIKISKFYDKDLVENSCKKALELYTFPHYKQIIEIIKNSENTENKVKNKNESINIRGSEYYK